MINFNHLRAVTVGVIGGKTRAYLPMAYGVSTFNLGLTFFLDAGDDCGTDPRGFIGWEDQTKTVFFVGVLSMTGVNSPQLLLLVYTAGFGRMGLISARLAHSCLCSIYETKNDHQKICLDFGAT